MEYKIVCIPKRPGKFREICIISNEDKERLRNLLPELEGVLLSQDTTKANFAFEKGKNCALNAMQHIGYKYTLSMDLEDFFDSINPQHVSDLIAEEIIKECFVNGAPKQGLPTSPIIATIAFLRCDEEIVQMLGDKKIDAVYTRYADDLIFSFNNKKDAGKISNLVRRIIERSGFKINNNKTRIQNSKNGRIVITGIGVDAEGIHPTRRTKKRIRAAIHQKNLVELQGLLEWEKCKLPKLVELLESNSTIDSFVESEIDHIGFNSD